LNAKRAVLAVTISVIAVAGVLPLLFMLAESVRVEGGFTAARYSELFSSPRTWALLARSVLLAGLTTAGTLLIGVPLALLLGKTDLPFGKGLAALFSVPLLIPPYVAAVSWFHLAGREGVLAGWLGSSFGETASRTLFGLGGCVLVHVTIFLPVVIILVMTAIKTIDPRLEEAARLAASRRKVLAGITLPLLRPGILLSALLVFILSLGELSVPLFLRYDVFPVVSFTAFSASYDFGGAAAASFPLILVTFSVIALERLAVGAKIWQLRPAPDSGGSLLVKLGPSKRFILPAVLLVWLFLVGAPLGVLLFRSASFNVYREAFERAGDSLLRSLLYAAAGASVLTGLGFFIGYFIHTRAVKWWRALDSATLFLFAVPGTVLGIGLISLWNRPGLGVVYAGPLVVIIGYVARYTALSSRITAAALARIPPSMEEAARTAGARWLRLVTRISAPLIRRSLAGAWIVCYVFCLRETEIALLLNPPGGDTLPVRTFTLMANGSAELIAALCVVMVAAAVLPLALLGALVRAGRRRAKVRCSE